MSKIEVFEPALCCATGVCGEDVDQELVTFSADMDFVRSRGGDIARYNLASEPQAFAANEAVKAFLHVSGSAGLPLVLVDGVTAMTGRYPDRAQLATWAGLEVPHRRLAAGFSTSPTPAARGAAAGELRAAAEMKFLDHPPRFLFFTGKGGVGKTSIACATAITLAGQGRTVLLVSTDPASNVGQVFGLTIGNTITAIPAVDGLSALEIDPEQAAEAYRERIVGPVRGLLPEAEVASITEQLSGSCTTEIASFNEFTELLTDSGGQIGQFDHVLFDTAPTGHTIRLLQLPGSWTDFLNEGKGDASCLGPLAGLEKQRAVYAEAVAALADPARTRLVLVARAQTSTLAEITRTHRELAAIGLKHQYVVINGVLPAPADDSDPLASAIYRREQQAIAAVPDELRALPMDQVELKATNIVGLDALASLFTPERNPPEPGEAPASRCPMRRWPRWSTRSPPATKG